MLVFLQLIIMRGDDQPIDLVAHELTEVALFFGGLVQGITDQYLIAPLKKGVFEVHG